MCVFVFMQNPARENEIMTIAIVTPRHSVMCPPARDRRYAAVRGLQGPVLPQPLNPQPASRNPWPHGVDACDVSFSVLFGARGEVNTSRKCPCRR